MSGHKHTPGPWSLESNGYAHVITKDGGSIAAVWPETLHPVTPLPAEANARLIAAAPDLLRVAQAFIAAVEDDGEPAPGTRWHAEYVAAKAAVAKA